MFYYVGDGRMDSPGFCAQYCTYTLLEYNTKDIVACEIIDKRMTAMKSTYMEKEGLQRAMRNLMDNGVVIKELCTDASTSIAAMISMYHILCVFMPWHTKYEGNIVFLSLSSSVSLRLKFLVKLDFRELSPVCLFVGPSVC